MGAQSLVSQGYHGYAGWGDAEAEADFKATGGAGKGGPKSSSGGGSGFSSLNPQDTIRAAIDAMKEANKPAVESLQASIPETQAKYAQTRQQLTAQQAPLEQRYKDLLDSIKGNQQVAENRQTLTTNNELGRRGISGSSGIAQQEITNAVNPITQQYTGLQKETGLAREESIRGLQNQIANLTPQETSDMRAIQNMIGQLSSGAGQAGLSAGMNLYSTNLQAQQAAQQREDNLRQQQIANQLAQAQQAMAERQYKEIQLPQSQYALNKPYWKPESAGPSQSLEDLIRAAGG